MTRRPERRGELSAPGGRLRLITATAGAFFQAPPSTPAQPGASGKKPAAVLSFRRDLQPACMSAARRVTDGTIQPLGKVAPAEASSGATGAHSSIFRSAGLCSD